MSEVPVLRALFDRWESVWHEGQYNFVGDCVAAAYIRHDKSGTRRVTPAEYAAELAANRQARPSTRIVVYEHAFVGDRAWFRFALQWTDPGTGEAHIRAGMRLYRIEGGKLAETWVTLLKLGSAWPDAAGQERWTSSRVV